MAGSAEDRAARPLLVGEANPYGDDPRFALYPEPDGCAGWRLCHQVLGLSETAYLRAFDRVNLCGERWSIRVARAAAVVFRQRTGPKILLGAKVCAAWGLAFLPLTGVDDVVILPHPSGRSRLWNEPDAVQRARALVLPLLEAKP